MIVRPVDGESDVEPVGRADDEARHAAATHAHDRDALPMERMVRMDDRHPFRSYIRRGGSVR